MVWARWLDTPRRLATTARSLMDLGWEQNGKKPYEAPSGPVSYLQPTVASLGQPLAPAQLFLQVSQQDCGNEAKPTLRSTVLTEFRVEQPV